jgi:adenylate kinase
MTSGRISARISFFAIGRVMRVVFIGPPGSGKGTQARLLHERLGIVYVGTGDMLREEVRQGTELGKRVEPFLTQGRLVPDNLVNDIVAERLRRPDLPERFVMDGYPRTVAQAHSFNEILKQRRLELTAVIHFLIEEDVVIRRLSGRQRADDAEATVRHRLQEFRDTSRELLEHYRQQRLLHEVTAANSVENLYQTIVEILKAAGN